MDCNPPDSSVLGILQARILEWIAVPSSRGSSQPRDWTGVSCIGRWILLSLSHIGSPTVVSWDKQTSLSPGRWVAGDILGSKASEASPCPHCLSLLQHQWLSLTAEAAASDMILLLSTSPPNPSWQWFYTLRARHSWVKELSQREMAILLIHFRHLLAACEPTAKADTQIAPHTHRVLTSWAWVVCSGRWAACSVQIDVRLTRPTVHGVMKSQRWLSY